MRHTPVLSSSKDQSSYVKSRSDHSRLTISAAFTNVTLIILRVVNLSTIRLRCFYAHASQETIPTDGEDSNEGISKPVSGKG
jgi:hypothetical protein